MGYAAAGGQPCTAVQHKVVNALQTQSGGEALKPHPPLLVTV